MPLPHVSIEVVQWLEITLVHHGQICPELYHLRHFMQHHLSLHVSLGVDHPSHSGPKIALIRFLILLLLEMPHYNIGLEGFHQVLAIKKPLKGTQGSQAKSHFPKDKY